MASTNQHVIITDAAGNVVVPSSPAGQQTSANSTSIVIASDQGTLATQDAADGPASPGAAAAKSMLVGGLYNSTAPTLSGGQQAAVQLDAAGNIKSSNQGRTSAPSVTPTITAASAYAAGTVVGGLLTFANAVDAALSGILQRVTINCKSVQTAGFKLYVFSASPSSSMFTDKSAPSIAPADVGKLIDVISLASPDSGLGTHTLYVADGLADAFVLAASSLAAVLVTTGTPTFSGASDISISLGILKD